MVAVVDAAVIGALQTWITTEVRDRIAAAIRASVAASCAAGEGDAEHAAAALADARKRYQRLQRLALAIDDPLPETIAAMSEAAAEVRRLEAAHAAAARPAIDEVTAARLEAAALAEVDGIVAGLTIEGDKRRLILQRMFPDGLIFRPDGERFVIEGSARLTLPADRSG